MGTTQATEGYVEAGPVRLWYDEQGDPAGPPVVLVMGGDASSLWWPPALVDGLVTAGLRVVRLDNRDAGLSTYVDGAPYGLADMAGDVLALLDGLGVGRAHLLGVSLGGMIVQQVALAQADRVASLTLVTTTPGPDDRLAPADESVFAGLDRPVETPEDVAEQTIDFCRAVAGRRYPFDEPYHRALVAADTARGVNSASGQGHVLSASPSSVDDLASLRVPALVVGGTEDPVFPFDHSEALARAIPGATLVRWDGVGHELPLPLMAALAHAVADHVRAAG